jgi:hypothetical protein
MKILDSTAIGRRARSRDSILDSESTSQALDLCSFNRITDDGERRTQANSRKPLFTPVHGCSSVSVAVPNSLTDQTVIGSDRSIHMSLEKQQIGPNPVPILE